VKGAVQAGGDAERSIRQCWSTTVLSLARVAVPEVACRVRRPMDTRSDPFTATRVLPEAVKPLVVAARLHLSTREGILGAGRTFHLRHGAGGLLGLHHRHDRVARPGSGRVGKSSAGISRNSDSSARTHDL